MLRNRKLTPFAFALLVSALSIACAADGTSDATSAEAAMETSSHYDELEGSAASPLHRPRELSLEMRAIEAAIFRKYRTFVHTPNTVTVMSGPAAHLRVKGLWAFAEVAVRVYDATDFEMNGPRARPVNGNGSSFALLHYSKNAEGKNEWWVVEWTMGSSMEGVDLSAEWGPKHPSLPPGVVPHEL